MASKSWVVLVFAVGLATPLACRDGAVTASDGGAGAVAAGGSSQGGAAGTAHAGSHATGAAAGSGAAGTGAAGSGSGGAGGIPDDPYGSLIPPLWTKATIPQRDLTNCDIFVGDASRVPWPPAAWQPKGAYDVFVVKQPQSEWMYQGIPRAWTLARHRAGGVDALFLHLEHGGRHEGNEAITFARVVRVSDLATVGVIANRFSHTSTVVCGQGNYRETALDVEFSGLIEPFTSRFHPATSTWTFAPRAKAFSGTHAFDLDEPTQLFVTSSGQVLKLNQADGSAISIRSKSAARYPASVGDTGVWTEDSELWGLVGDEAPRRLATGAPEYPCSIGVTPEWVFGAGEQTASGLCRQYPTNGRVWRAKRNPDGSVGSVEFGPTIIVEAFFSYARGWGDYVGFVATIQGKAEVFVVRMSDWKTWQLNKGSGDGFHSAVWGLDGKYLYVGINHSNLELEELRRYPLSGLDTTATALPSVN